MILFSRLFRDRNSCCCFCVELVNYLSVHRYCVTVLIFFHILALREYWVLTESRIPLKSVLGGVRIVASTIINFFNNWPTGVYLLDFFCSRIQLYLLLSPYLCFISFLYLDLYVLGDDELIS